MRVLKCRKGIGPKVSGMVLSANDNFSARYDLDRINGVFSRPNHKLFGKSYVDTILVLNESKGGVDAGHTPVNIFRNIVHTINRK